jgi:hypothetical protein
MSMYDIVIGTTPKGEEFELQFKSGRRIGWIYKEGEEIELPDGIHFCHEGCFVVLSGKIMAVYDKPSAPLWDKWGGSVPWPELKWPEL